MRNNGTLTERNSKKEFILHFKFKVTLYAFIPDFPNIFIPKNLNGFKILYLMINMRGMMVSSGGRRD